MRRLATVVACVFSFMSFPAKADTFYVDGNALLSRCNADEENFSKDILTGNCLGYVAGVVDSYEIAQSSGIMRRYYCLPEGRISVRQLTDITIDYLENNPADRHHIGSSLILRALIAAFPCRADDQ